MDITYCMRSDCKNKDCERHHDNIPVGVPVSVADFKECEKYQISTHTPLAGRDQP